MTNPLFQQIQDYMNSECYKSKCECISLCIQFVFGAQLETISKLIIPIFMSFCESRNDALISSLIDSIPVFCEKLLDEFDGDNSLEFIQKSVLPIFYQSFYNINYKNIRKYMKSFAETLLLLSEINKRIIVSQIDILNVFLNENNANALHAMTDFLINIEPIYSPELFNFMNEFVQLLMKDNRPAIKQDSIKIIASYGKHLMNEKECKLFCSYYLEMMKCSSLLVKTVGVQMFSNFIRDLDESYLSEFGRPILKQMLCDKTNVINKILKMHAGELITYFESNTEDELIEIYKSLFTSNNLDEVYKACFSFPGVIGSLGSKYIDSFLPLLKSALDIPSINIKRTISYGLISYVHLLPHETIKEMCITLLNSDSSIAMGIISNFHQFFQFIDEKKEFIVYLQNPKQYHDWRFRRCISEQIRYCYDYFPGSIKKDLFEAAIELVKDDVAAVRKDAISTVGIIMKSENVSSLQELAKSDRYWDRWSAASILSICSSDIAEDNLEILKLLCKDPTANVRIAAAKTAIELLGYSSYAKAELSEAIEYLKSDEEITVKQIVDVL